VQIIDRLQHLFPLIAGVIITLAGASWHVGEMTLIGLGLTCYGVYALNRGTKPQNR
jgi:hypothetical protein